MYGLTVCVKEGLSFAWDLSLENSADSYLCFRLTLLHSMSYFFFLYQSPSPSVRIVFDCISSNIDEIFSIILSATAFVFGDFNVYHKVWLTYSGGTDRPGELCFVLQWLYLHWEIVIMLSSQFPLTFNQIQNRIPCFIAQLMTILVLIGTVFMII